MSESDLKKRTKAFALRPIGPELCHRDANGHAGMAPIAIWAVGEPPAPPEPLPDELAIDVRVDQMAWRRDLRPRDLVGQVTARVGSCRIELQRR